MIEGRHTSRILITIAHALAETVDEASPAYSKLVLLLLPFTMKDLNQTLQNVKQKKALGPEGITGDMLKHLGSSTKSVLLKIFNQSWTTWFVPPIWKEAEIVPIQKKGKEKKDPNSYRPISLLSSVGKLLERIINRRLVFFLEAKNLISSTQTGYRTHRSTEDQLALLVQDIENGFQEKKKTLSVFFDWTKAFDKVWNEGLPCLQVYRAICTDGSNTIFWQNS